MIKEVKKIEPVFREIEDRILEELNLAQKSIRVAVGWFKSSKLLSKLEEKAKAGLQVEVVTSDEELANNKEVLQAISEAHLDIIKLQLENWAEDEKKKFRTGYSNGTGNHN